MAVLSVWGERLGVRCVLLLYFEGLQWLREASVTFHHTHAIHKAPLTGFTIIHCCWEWNGLNVLNVKVEGMSEEKDRKIASPHSLSLALSLFLPP